MRILTHAAIIVKREVLGVYYTFFHKFLFDDFSIRADGGSVKTDDRDFVLGDNGWLRHRPFESPLEATLRVQGPSC